MNHRGILAAALLIVVVSVTSARSAGGSDSLIRIVEARGMVEVRPENTDDWVLTRTNQVLGPGWRLRTGTNSQASLLWSDRSVLRFDELTEVEILRPSASGSSPVLNFARGVLSFFHRDQPGRIRIVSRGMRASVEGTEFVMRSDNRHGTNALSLHVIDGRVRFGNEVISVLVTNGWGATILEDGSLSRSRGILAKDLLQWALYYPAVLDLRDLPLTQEERNELEESLNAYRSGNLVAALATGPRPAETTSAAQRVYLAALLLSMGQVEKTESVLAGLDDLEPNSRERRLADALRTLIAAVRFNVAPNPVRRQLPTELLAASYYEQSKAQGDQSLAKALDLARQATRESPAFGFAWARAGELQLSFGHNHRAEAAVDESLRLSPNNAQALAVKGFILAARNDTGGALLWFNRAIEADPGLANGWLGRGLSRISCGDRETGRQDLLIAAALEPQRALLRSYLGKAFGDAGEERLAEHELQLARVLDPNDPTSWLYSALLLQQQNRINEAITALEQSRELNDNRSLFRSRMLLDQDRAVRGANLASVYRDAGMRDTSLREAARAVTYDYANSSAHLFISDSYSALRDPTRFNLRAETVWFNELLLANLLAPAGAARLSQTLGQLNYSPLFESAHAGLASSTSFRTDEQFRQLASQFGTIDNTSWALDLDYQRNEGVRPNNGLDRIEWYTTVKQQLTPDDSWLLLVKYQDYDSGDNFQYYQPTNARPNFSFKEKQEPLVVGGYQHQWAPGVRTLALGGRLVSRQDFADRQSGQTVLQPPGGSVVPLDVALDADLEIYTAELEQIVQLNRVTFIAGAQWQGGEFNSSSTLSNPMGVLAPLFPTNPITGSHAGDFQRLKGYGYVTIEPLDQLWLTAGLGYDHLTMPENFRNPPLSPGTETRELPGPKAALVWNPTRLITVRGIYSRSLGGVSLDESFRLEPTQLAGFPQAFRTVISESIAGSVAAPEYDVTGVALDLKPGPRTYLGLQAYRVESLVKRTVGVFAFDSGLGMFRPSTTREELDYDEFNFSASINQLIGEEFALGADYRFTHAELETRFPEVPVPPFTSPDRDERSELHRIGAYALYNHPGGFFTRLDAACYIQANSGYMPDQPGDEFVQLDWMLGYRLAKRRVEIAAGILNLTDTDYRLNPLTIHPELPRERVFFARVDFRF